MKAYKEQLLQTLSAGGWALVEIDDFTEWWADEHWKIASRRNEWGLELWLTYLVDPMYDGNDKSSAVWAVQAAAVKPIARPVNRGDEVSHMVLSKGKYGENMRAFVDDMNDYRDSRATKAP